jgi:hypothetical protein
MQLCSVCQKWKKSSQEETEANRMFDYLATQRYAIAVGGVPRQLGTQVDYLQEAYVTIVAHTPSKSARAIL